MENISTQTISWIKRLFAWMARAQLTGFCLSIIFLAMFLSFNKGTEDSIRLGGLLLQLLGIAAAATGIRDTRRLFGKPSFFQLARNWISTAPRFKPDTQTVNASLNLSVKVSMSVEASMEAGPNTPIEERLSMVESALQELKTRIRLTERSISDNHRELTQRIVSESTIRTDQDLILRLRIEAASTDGLYLAVVGAFWLAIGVIMSTAPKELLLLAGIP